jgi:hypothetical protein
MLKHETEQFERTVRMILDSPSLDNMQKEHLERLFQEIEKIFTEREK